MTMKLVSVVVPCYKDSKTLSRAIESVLCQTYSPIELIVINDCSPETIEIESCLKKYPGLRYFRNKKNIGLAATRNKGIQYSSGEFVAFLDADDEYHKDKIKIQMESLEVGTVVTCAVSNISFDKVLVKRFQKIRQFVSPNQILFANNLNGAGLLGSKKLILNMGGFNPELRSCEDFDLWLRLLYNGVRVKVLDNPLYLYHYNPHGLSKNLRNISKWEIKVLELHAERMGGDWKSSEIYGWAITFWLLKHLFRSEITRNYKLRVDTKMNVVLLDDFLLRKIFLISMIHLRLFAVFSIFLRIYFMLIDFLRRRKF